ncbi:hypothetical protein AAEO56_02335 [Flavobacterium sp. DGU11]|uniref:Uncharacterized protein n=1 Tax=Flavobacterium arundinis TaxID=3139143 RepID=A0ABU9HSY0_9FLAO
MERYMPKTVRVATLFAVLMLGGPFLKIPGETIDNGSHMHVMYDRLSGYDVVIETAMAYGQPNFSSGEGIMVLLIIVFGIAALVQFAGAMAMKGRIVLYTAIFIFAGLFSVLIFMYRNDMLYIVRWGCYAYLAIQALLIIIAGNKRPKTTL